MTYLTALPNPFMSLASPRVKRTRKLLRKAMKRAKRRVRK